ncbi:MAG: hypothetical protein FE037_01195 [Thermoplasmata archaeon]|nr:MAG: hypothetical protein FE042_00720 [Thermoplasmata archaeon]KAA0016804.1 MAG: hypothetical protein FE037_01195 [Thermoplasmata archaeon]
MRSSPYSRFCKRILRDVFRKMKIYDEDKDHIMEMADIRMTYEEYYSMTIITTILVFISSLIASLIIYMLIPSNITMALVFLLPVISVLSVSSYFLFLPESRANARAKKIDVLLPYAVNFIATMSSAGLSPAEIFKRLSNVDLYDEIQKEFRKIAKEIYLMGVDTITALKHAMERSPSRKFKDFIQGIISTIQSGSDLNMYLKNIVEKYMQLDLMERKKSLESLAVVAEMFVISVIAMPLFLVIIISTMSLTSSGGTIPFNFIYLLSFFILPAAYFGFYMMMKSVSVEA